PHLLSRRRGQPVSSVPARRRLLALMLDAPGHAETLRMARRPIRHLAAAPDQARRPRRRVQDPDQDPPAVKRSRSDDLQLTPRAPAAPRHLPAGAFAPDIRRSPPPSSAYPIPTDKTRRGGTGSARLWHHPTTTTSTASYTFETCILLVHRPG